MESDFLVEALAWLVEKREVALGTTGLIEWMALEEEFGREMIS